MDISEAATARKLRDSGMALAADAQDRTIPNWSALAYMAILSVARRQSHVHVDDVTAIFQHPPAHHNAWGSVWMRCIKDGVIERTGELRTCSDPRKHKHASPLYRSLMFQGCMTDDERKETA